MSKVYTLAGDIDPIDDKHNGLFFFRKIVDLSDPAAHMERFISLMLKDSPCKNVARVYELGPDFIDIELLDTAHDDTSMRARDIKDALKQLHTKGIVYVDLKLDNMGYSHADGVWKLFDFDGSGIFNLKDKNKWIFPAPSHFKIYKTLAPKVDKRYGGRPTAFDKLAFRSLFKDDIDKAKHVKTDDGHDHDDGAKGEGCLSAACPEGLNATVDGVKGE